MRELTNFPPNDHLQEFLPFLRTAAKASKILGMSTRKAAVICISSCLGSVQSTMQTYEYFSAVPYRISKVGATFLTHYWSGTSYPPCLLFFKSDLTFCCCIFPVCSEHAHHVCCNRAQEGRDLVFFAAPWLGADRHGWRERESQLKSNNNLQK